MPMFFGIRDTEGVIRKGFLSVLAPVVYVGLSIEGKHSTVKWFFLPLAAIMVLYFAILCFVARFVIGSG